MRRKGTLMGQTEGVDGRRTVVGMNFIGEESIFKKIDCI